MTERRLSPTAASAQARKAVRNRLKLARLNRQTDSPEEFARRIAALLQEAAHDNPGDWSPAYTEFVLNRYTDRLVELRRLAPSKVGAR